MYFLPPRNLRKDSVNPTFYIIAPVRPPWYVAFQGKKYRQAWCLSYKQANISLLPCQMSLCIVGVVGAVLQVRLAPSMDPQLQTGSCSFSVSLRRGLWSGTGHCCRWNKSSSLFSHGKAMGSTANGASIVDLAHVSRASCFALPASV